jgi:hypothetical protein
LIRDFAQDHLHSLSGLFELFFRRRREDSEEIGEPSIGHCDPSPRLDLFTTISLGGKLSKGCTGAFLVPFAQLSNRLSSPQLLEVFPCEPGKERQLALCQSLRQAL